MPQYRQGGGGTETYKPAVSHGPRRIFLGWTALVFVAAGGYYYVKTSNSEKKRKYFEAIGNRNKPTLGDRA
jgi:hypothetical protein